MYDFILLIREYLFKWTIKLQNDFQNDLELK